MNALRTFRHTSTLALALVSSIAAFEASAAYTCTLSVTAISTVYSPSVQNDNTGSITMNCTKAAGDAAAMNYTLGANNGLQPTGGGTRRVQRGATAERYNYFLYRDAGFSQIWTTAGNDFDQGTNPFNFGGSNSASITIPFYLRLPVDATPGAAGNYTDTVLVTLNPQGGGNTATANLFVTAITTNSCQVMLSPGNINFTYTSFQPGPAAASSTFGMRCTTAFPYNMALDATSGTLLGLNYTLSVPAGATGNGLTQTHTINGGITASQAGTCATASCSGTQTRTLTISW